MGTNRTKPVETTAAALLKEHGFHRAPVPVDKLAKALGLSLMPATLGDGISGVLVVEGKTGTIGYDPTQAPVRQRFTIAHEVGHFVLHTSDSSLFIDKQYTAIFRRDQQSETGEHLREIQANQFAAALLMPEELLFKEIRSMQFDQGDEQCLRDLADRFQVSTQAMSIRLSSLSFFQLQ